MVEKFPGANTLEVTKGVEDALDKLKPGLPGMQTDTSVFRPASFIEDAIDNLTLAIVIAARPAGARARRVPVPVADRADRARDDPGVARRGGARARPARRDLQRDLLRGARRGARGGRSTTRSSAPRTSPRRLRQQREAGSDESIAQIVIEASHEVRSPLAYATLIALLAIVPVAVMEGRPGAFFEPLALAYALAVVAAMVVALTSRRRSACCSSRGARPGGASLRSCGGCAPRYDGALARFVGRPRTALIAAGACVVVGARRAAAARRPR